MKVKFSLAFMCLMMGTPGFAMNMQAYIPHDSYIDVGFNYLYSNSSRYTLERINPIEGSIVPPMKTGSLTDRTMSYHIGAGFNYTMISNWVIGPEISILQLGTFRKRINNFISVLPPNNENTFTSTLDGRIYSLHINMEYAFQPKLSFYVKPGLGMAMTDTTNIIAVRSIDDPVTVYERSSERQSNLSPQLSLGVKYQMAPKTFVDMGLNYIYLGKVRAGNLSADEDQFTSTKIEFHHADLFGPSLSLVYYL